MQERNLKKNYIFNLLYQALRVLTPVITTPYVSRVLGADGVGSVSFAESVASYFVLLATFGIAAYGQREVSYVQNDEHKRSAAFWNTVILQLTTSFAALLLYGLFILITNGNSAIRLLYFIFTINIVAVLVDVTWFFQGIEKFDKVAIRNIICQLLSIAFIFLFVKGKGDEGKYVFGMTFFILLANASLWADVPKYVKKVSRTCLVPFKDFRIVCRLFVPSIAIQIYGVLDKTMLGVIIGNDFENGYYEQAMKVPRGLLVIVNALGTVVIPKVGQAFGKNDWDEVKKLVYGVYRAVWMLAVPFCLGLILTSDYFVPWFYGPGFEKVALLLKVAAPIILFIGINSTTALEYLVPTKRENLFSKAVLTGALVNFCLNIVMIRYFQSVGAAAASVIAEFIINVVEFASIRGEISVKKVIGTGKNYFIAGGLMTIVLLIMRAVSLPRNIIGTAVMVLAGAVIYIGSLLVLKDELVLDFLKTRKV